MRSGELDCIHGIGHSANNHGCDGCCFVLGVYERERIIKLLEAEIKRVSTPMLVEREYLDGLEEAIDIVKGEKK
jgi:hypothetical protein